MSSVTEPALNRRAFLGIAAAGTAAVVLPLSRASRAPRAARVASSAGRTPADWAALAHDLSGTLVRPADSYYTVARRLFDPRPDSISPAGVAYRKNPHDIATCLAFVYWSSRGFPAVLTWGAHASQQVTAVLLPVLSSSWISGVSPGSRTTLL